MAKKRTRANGTGTAYKHGKTWAASAVIGYKPTADGKSKPIRVYKYGFKTKTEALEYLPTLKEGKTAKKKTVNLDGLYKSFMSANAARLSNSKQTHYITARKRLESVAYVDIRLLGIDDLQGIIDENTTTYYPAKDIKNLLSNLYKRAIAEQVVSVNLAEYIVLPPLHEKETVPFTEQEIITLWQEWKKAEDTVIGCTLLMIYTGMMPGELFTLQKDMIDFKAQAITGAGLKTEIRKEKPIILPNIIVPVLQTLCDKSETDKVLPMRHEKFYDKFKEMVSALGLNTDLRPYSCRHTTATTLGRTNTPLFEIKDILRHAKITTTQKYVHIGADPLIAAANSVFGDKNVQQ